MELLVDSIPNSQNKHHRNCIYIFLIPLVNTNYTKNVSFLLLHELDMSKLYFSTVILIYNINCGVKQGFPALRKVVTTHVKKMVFFTCIDIANQLLTRHSPLTPLSQVDEWSARPSRFSMQAVCRSFFELWQLKH